MMMTDIIANVFQKSASVILCSIMIVFPCFISCVDYTKRNNKFIIYFASVAQLDRALASEAKGQKFESSQALNLFFPQLKLYFQ